MIGWALAGAWVGFEQAAHANRKAAKLERRRATAPDVRKAWIVFAVFAVVCLIGNPASVAGLVLIGVCVWAWLRKRTAEHAAWLAEQNTTAMPSHGEATRLAQAYEQAGMPESARAMRDLHAG